MHQIYGAKGVSPQKKLFLDGFCTAFTLHAEAGGTTGLIFPEVALWFTLWRTGLAILYAPGRQTRLWEHNLMSAIDTVAHESLEACRGYYYDRIRMSTLLLSSILLLPKISA